MKTTTTAEKMRFSFFVFFFNIYSRILEGGENEVFFASLDA
jgi:hypothetical protein